MNITILANRDLHANVAINLLRPLIQNHTVNVFLSKKVGVPKSGWVACEALQQLNFIEQQMFCEIIEPLTQKSLFTVERFWTFEEMNAQFSCCRELDEINTFEGLNVLESTNPELVISIRYGKIIKEPIISIPTYGVINLHSGLLPHYGGILTTLHALVAEEQKIGCTLHYIENAEIDKGAIIDSASLDADPNRSLFWHVSQLYPLGVKMIEHAVNTISQGNVLSCIPQDIRQQQYFGLPEAHHFEQLASKNIRVWESEDVLNVYNQFLGKDM